MRWPRRSTSGLQITGVDRADVRAVGLDTPGPASAEGVISSKGATNFALPEWWGFDVRTALEARLGIPVVYSNDGNAAALYAHYAYYGENALRRSSVSAIVGTGLGGGVIESGAVVRGAAGMAGELGHVHIPMDGLLGEGQPMPQLQLRVRRRRRERGVAHRYPPQPAAVLADPIPAITSWSGMPIDEAAKELRGFGERGDEMARKIFEQQAMAIGRLFTIAANFTDPNGYFVGGGVVEAAPEFRDWYLSVVRTNTQLRAEQLDVAEFSLGTRSRHGRRTWSRRCGA